MIFKHHNSRSQALIVQTFQCNSSSFILQSHGSVRRMSSSVGMLLPPHASLSPCFVMASPTVLTTLMNSTVLRCVLVMSSGAGKAGASPRHGLVMDGPIVMQGKTRRTVVSVRVWRCGWWKGVRPDIMSSGSAKRGLGGA